MYPTQYDWTYHHSMMDGGGYGWIGLIVTLFIVGGLIAAAIYIARMFIDRSSTTARHDPLDIARERYAKGEISKEELAEIKQELK